MCSAISPSSIHKDVHESNSNPVLSATHSEGKAAEDDKQGHQIEMSSRSLPSTEFYGRLKKYFCTLEPLLILGYWGRAKEKE